MSYGKYPIKLQDVVKTKYTGKVTIIGLHRTMAVRLSEFRQCYLTTNLENNYAVLTFKNGKVLNKYFKWIKCTVIDYYVEVCLDDILKQKFILWKLI